MLMAAFIMIDGTVFAVYAMCSALWHELAHVIALRLCRGRVRRVVTRGFGLRLETEPLTYGKEAVAAAAGPLASLAAAALFAMIPQSRTVTFAAFSNAALFALNALPIYPLDGGRVLYCLLCRRLTPERAGAITRAVTYTFMAPLAAAGVALVVRSGYNFSLLVILGYVAATLVRSNELR